MFYYTYVLFLLCLLLLSLIAFLHDSRNTKRDLRSAEPGVITHMALLQRLLHQEEASNQYRWWGHCLGMSSWNRNGSRV